MFYVLFVSTLKMFLLNFGRCLVIEIIHNEQFCRKLPRPKAISCFYQKADMLGDG